VIKITKKKIKLDGLNPKEYLEFKQEMAKIRAKKQKYYGIKKREVDKDDIKQSENRMW
jgi:hypothetical protein